jgi:hypothetical protein
MPPKTDPQRDNLYWMEAEFNGWWGLARSPRSALEGFAIAVCKYYKVDPPRIIISRKPSKHDGDYLHGEVTLYIGKGDNPGVLVHELAHHVVDELYADVEHHGPEFMAIYMHLLDKWRILPHEEFRRLARKYKLRIGRRYRPAAFRGRTKTGTR